MRSLQALLLIVAAAGLVALAHAEKDVLVLVEDVSSAKQTFSQFLDALQQHGFRLDIKNHKAGGLKLRDYDTWLYQHLVLLAPKAAGFGGDITSNGILEFVDAGHNLLIAGSADASDTVRALAAEAGVEFDDKGTSVVDHFSYQAAGGATDSTLVASSSVVDAPSILGKGLEAPILFQGIAQTVPTESELVTVALSASPTGYSHDPKKAMREPPALPVGDSAALVTLVQARNNARIMVAGSLAMFSDAFFNAKVKVSGSGKEYARSGNKAFCVEAARWTLQDRGVLVAENMRHHLVGSDDQPGLYRVEDEVEFLIDIWELEGGQRKPYKGDDVMLSFIMLDPYVRQPLQTDGSGTFSLQFKVPDVYGVFKYVIDYKHRGYSYIDLTHVVPVRPFKHDEYERFIVAAYPYYASALSCMAAFFLVGLTFLYSKQ